jgi:hypothetical protein
MARKLTLREEANRPLREGGALKLFVQAPGLAH